MNNGNINNNNKNNTNRVRAVAPVPVAATPRVIYDIPFSSVIEAWIDCERNKRSSNSCTKFRWHAARDLVALWQQMRTATYVPLKSMCFMVTVPVLREVWAGAFRDRVAHHWEALRFGPLIEKYFVEVGDVSMNCRKGYGSLRAVQTMEKSLYEFSEGYTRDDCYIVGGDFSNFFMSIDKAMLWEFLEFLVMDEYTGPDIQALLYMMRTTLFHRCQENYYRKSPVEMWRNLPPRKSLFHMDGLPIGNLPSQLWANLVGAVFTSWVIHCKKVNGFIIFVDDWRALFRSLEDGRRFLEEAKAFLRDDLHVTLHPDKVYLQHYSKGTKMVGAVIKPGCNRSVRQAAASALHSWVLRGLSRNHIAVAKFRKFLIANAAPRSIPGTRVTRPGRTYIANRTRGHFIKAMLDFNARYTSDRERIEALEQIRASINSYLGLMCHYNSYKVRRRICEKYIIPAWGKYLYFVEDFTKCVIKAEYNRLYTLRRKLKNGRYARKFLRPKWQG